MNGGLVAKVNDQWGGDGETVAPTLNSEKVGDYGGSRGLHGALQGLMKVIISNDKLSFQMISYHFQMISLKKVESQMIHG